MGKLSDSKERRRHRRISKFLPLHFQIDEDEGPYPGITMDISPSGILFQTLKDMPVGKKIVLEVVPPEKLGLSKIKAEAEIVWKDTGYWEDIEGYQYGLKLLFLSPEDQSKLNLILNKLKINETAE